ncbi:MAG: site-specific DNA-methyltransferase [Bryobacterales bacterium]|nr:site-specific DNA-methyltransferase [Bryobacterales bacterium]
MTVTKGAIYVCMSSSELHTLHRAFTESGGHWSTFVIWAKNTFTMGRSDYQRQYEPILYGWKDGTDHFWCLRQSSNESASLMTWAIRTNSRFNSDEVSESRGREGSLAAWYSPILDCSKGLALTAIQTTRTPSCAAASSNGGSSLWAMKSEAKKYRLTSKMATDADFRLSWIDSFHFCPGRILVSSQSTNSSSLMNGRRARIHDGHLVVDLEAYADLYRQTAEALEKPLAPTPKSGRQALIRKFCKDHGATVTDVAEWANVNRSDLNKWKLGKDEIPDGGERALRIEKLLQRDQRTRP